MFQIPFLKACASKGLFNLLHILIFSESSFFPIKYDTNRTQGLIHQLMHCWGTYELWITAHGHENTRKSKHCRSKHIICSLIYYLFGRQCSKLPCIYGQLGRLWWNAVDRSMARGNMIAIIRNHGKSDSCINGYSLLWYFKMSTHHHKLSGGKKFKDVERGKNTSICSSLIKSLFEIFLITGI